MEGRGRTGTAEAQHSRSGSCRMGKVAPGREEFNLRLDKVAQSAAA